MPPDGILRRWCRAHHSRGRYAHDAGERSVDAAGGTGGWPRPEGDGQPPGLSADAAPGHFGIFSPLSRKVMALTAVSRPFTAVTPAMTSPTWQAPSKPPSPASARMTDAPSILAGSTMP